MGFINIGRKNVAVAAGHVVELPPRCSKKNVVLVNVLKNNAKLIIFSQRGGARGSQKFTDP